MSAGTRSKKKKIPPSCRFLFSFFLHSGTTVAWIFPYCLVTLVQVRNKLERLSGAIYMCLLSHLTTQPSIITHHWQPFAQEQKYKHQNTTAMWCRLQTDLFLSHLLSEPFRELDSSIIVAGGPNAPDKSKDEPGFNQLMETSQLFLGDRLLPLKNGRYTVSSTVLRLWHVLNTGA